jgi:hypothetical protein
MPKSSVFSLNNKTHRGTIKDIENISTTEILSVMSLKRKNRSFQ